MLRRSTSRALNEWKRAIAAADGEIVFECTIGSVRREVRVTHPMDVPEFNDCAGGTSHPSLSDHRGFYWPGSWNSYDKYRDIKTGQTARLLLGLPPGAPR